MMGGPAMPPLLLRPAVAAAPRLRMAAAAPRFDDNASVRRNDAAANGPAARPLPELNAVEAVRIQLDALMANDVPRQDHGLEVVYLFANVEGEFDGRLSRYFGSAADLYHFGHFALKFKTRFPGLLNMESYEVLKASDSRIVARVTRDQEETTWQFNMSMVWRGKSSYWLTDSITQLNELHE